ncbi:hypothetical protein [Tsukamurella tyrosinosolvens]|uniref:hypothetical protein n=1 Tax=Tsukamurella tyrosinosolvens TaxID=57704 RepID=UPI000C7F37FA|nr:hypothetical protein [Tsukamurella tyrosinosolvens]AUN42491.1 hypothetical protein ASU32_22755 [Tsukamurella tyrosinosolvens]
MTNEPTGDGSEHAWANEWPDEYVVTNQLRRVLDENGAMSTAAFIVTMAVGDLEKRLLRLEATVLPFDHPGGE